MDVSLRAAALSDRPKIFEWLAKSDATPEMLGPPTFPDAPVPDFDEFCADYDEEAFRGGGDFRLFVISAGAREIGALSYYIRDGIAELDLWIGSSSDWGHGYGSSALRMAAGMIERLESAAWMIIRPSARNPRAIAAYRKAGFAPHDLALHGVPDWCRTEGLDYADAVLLVQRVGGQDGS